MRARASGSHVDAGTRSRVDGPTLWVVGDRDVVRLVRGVGVAAEVRAVSPAVLLSDGAVPPGGVVVVGGGAAGRCGELAAVLARWAPYRPVVVLVADVARLLDLHAEYLAAAARDLRGDPRAAVHVVVGTTTPERLRRVLSAHLEQPLAAAAAATTSAPGAPGLVVPSPYALLHRGRRGRTIVVQGCAGGVGASTVAVAVADGVARRAPAMRVCVVRAGSGSETGALDVAAIAACGPQWLPGPNVHLLDCGDGGADPVCAEALPALVGALHRRFDVVLLDRPMSLLLPPLALPVDRVLLVTTLAAPSLAGLGRYAAELRDRADVLDDAAPTVRVVVNGALNGLGVEPRQVVDAALGAPIIAAVPFAVRDTTIALNTARVDRLLDHPDLGPVYLRLAGHAVPDAAQDPAPGHAERLRRRRLRHRVAPPAGGPSPFVVEHGDGRPAR